MTEPFRIMGAAQLSVTVARERQADPGCRIDLADLGNREYRIVVEPSPGMDDVAAVPTNGVGDGATGS